MEMDVLKRPVITEKTSAQGEDLNQYTFIVDKRAKKDQIKKAVEDFYGVKVAGVSTMNYMGKSKSRFIKSGFVSGKNKNFKKAVITVAEGEVIDFYENL